MPNEGIIEPISEQEKQEILARHHQLVDQMNTTLNGALKYDDEGILKRLNDPKEVALYRKSCQLVRDNQKRSQTFKTLEARFGKSQVRDNPMSRTIDFCLKTEDTLAAKRYNEKIYQDYISNPNRVVFHEFNKILNFNPQELYDCGDDKAKLVEFYAKHPDICENAFCVDPIMSASGANQKILDGMKSMKKVVEGLHDASTATKMAAGIDYFATPDLTPEQTEALVLGSNQTMMDPSESLKLIVNQKLPQDETYCTAFEMLDRFKAIGIPINDKHFYTKYKAVKTDPVTHTKEQVSFDQYFAQQRRANNNLIEPEITLEQRSEQELFEFRCITSEAKGEYCKEFEKRLAREIGQIHYNVAEIEDRNKGGIWERYIRHSTSREYKEFIAALKDYNNPDSPNYLNKPHLKEKATGYLLHKADQGYQGLDDMKGTSLSRSTLAINVIKVLDEMKNDEDTIFNDIETKLVGSYKDGAVVAIKPEDVKNELNQNEIVKEKVVEKEKQAEQIDETEINTMSIK